jgi:hypothetical protein
MSIVMETTRFDRVAKSVASGTTRRQALVGLGALVLGSAGLFGVRSPVAADKRDQCHQRCRQRRSRNPRKPNNNNKLHDRCHRKCENR